MNMGRVFFIGAGPGDPELLTLKGQRLISEADLVLYAGSLVPPEVVACAKKGARVEDSAPLCLEETHALMRDCALGGGMVARVHTGDPSLYGAVREQARLLDADCGGGQGFLHRAGNNPDTDHHPAGGAHPRSRTGTPAGACRPRKLAGHLSLRFRARSHAGGTSGRPAAGNPDTLRLPRGLAGSAHGLGPRGYAGRRHPGTGLHPSDGLSGASRTAPRG